MIRNILTATVATAAIAVAAPALAHPGGAAGGGLGASTAGGMAHGGLGAGFGTGPMSGGLGAGAMGGPSQSAIDARANSMGPANASPTGIEHASPNSVLNTNALGSSTIQRSSSRTNSDMDSDDQNVSGNEQNRGSNTINGAFNNLNSEGFQHASPNGILHASPNSILARNSLPSALLPGITTGLTVNTTSGTSLGTISNVLMTRNGSIAGVIVTSSTGQTYRIPASALSISGNVVTINSAEVLEGGVVPSSLLPGLTTGLTVDTSGGTSFGTISQINTTRNGAISSVVVTTSTGQTFTVPASSLSISGNTVTLNTTEAFESSGVPSSLLPGLTTGQAVDLSGGTSLGTISQINTGANGTITSVVVTTASGQTYTLPASSLSISGTTVTANTEDAFESTGVPSSLLPGLTTGLTVDTSAGTDLGTISQVFTNNGFVTDVVVTTSSGQNLVVPATSLSISGNTVTLASMD